MLKLLINHPDFICHLLPIQWKPLNVITDNVIDDSCDQIDKVTNTALKATY